MTRTRPITKAYLLDIITILLCTTTPKKDRLNVEYLYASVKYCLLAIFLDKILSFFESKGIISYKYGKMIPS